MCIKFFGSLTTHIYSLALSSPSQLRQTLLDYKEKKLTKDKLLKILQPNHQDFRRVRILFSFLDFIGNSPSVEYQSGLISIFTEYSPGPSDGLPSADSNSVHLLVYFESTTFLSPKSPSLTRVKKWCQHMPPSFGVIYPLLQN